MTDPMPRKDVELPPRMPEAAIIAELRAELAQARADAQAAVAEAIRLAAEEAASEGWPDENLLGVSEREEGAMDCANRIETAIRALADADGLAAVEALRKERDSLKAFVENDADWEFSAKRRLQLFREMRSERDSLAAELAASRAREAAHGAAGAKRNEDGGRVMGDFDLMRRIAVAEVMLEWAWNPGFTAQKHAYLFNAAPDPVTVDNIRQMFGDDAADAWLAIRKAKATFLKIAGSAP